MAKKLAGGEVKERGCMGFITLEEYLQALGGLDIEWRKPACKANGEERTAL